MSKYREMRELLTLLPETRKKVLRYLCSCRNDNRLRTIQHISKEAKLSFHTVKKIILRELAPMGYVKVYEIGRVKIIVPTEKLKEVCEVLEVEQAQ